MFKEEVISRKQCELLVLLNKNRILDNFYLAGGTAVALYLGHRFSDDFNFLTSQEFESNVLQEKLSSLGNFRTVGSVWGFLNGSLEGVMLSFAVYRHPLIGPTSIYCGVEVASLQDLGLMKLEAIAGRGFKRDFIDLYFIVREGVSLEELIELYPKKYPQGNLYNAIKSLAFFQDAEKQPSPRLTSPAVSWEEIKKFFTAAQKSLMQRLWS